MLSQSYEVCLERVPQVVASVVPPGSTVVVVSRGDPALLPNGERTGWHFPRTNEGVYAGAHPRDSADAIDHLELLRAEGGQFLVFPSTAFWWLEYYEDFKRHLESNYPLIVQRDDSCLIFDLRGTQEPPAEAAGESKYALERDQQDMRHMALLLAFTLAPDSNCIDVGASRGSVLKEMVRYAPHGRHIAYEPIPELSRDLAERFPGVDVRCAGLSTKRGEAGFVYVKSRPGYSGFREREYPGVEVLEHIEVATEDLDSSLPPDYVPTLIKIDVEGAEREVIEGAIETITRYKPMVVFEHGRGAADAYGTEPEHIYDLLCGVAGLRMFDLDGNGPYSREQFSESYNLGIRWNYVAHR